MKNKDMPAMPISNLEQALAIEGGNGGAFGGLTKREMFAMNAPEMPRELYVDFFNKHNSCDVNGYIAHDEPCLSAKGILAANKEWRYAYADLMLEE